MSRAVQARTTVSTCGSDSEIEAHPSAVGSVLSGVSKLFRYVPNNELAGARLRSSSVQQACLSIIDSRVTMRACIAFSVWCHCHATFIEFAESLIRSGLAYKDKPSRLSAAIRSRDGQLAKAAVIHRIPEVYTDDGDVRFLLGDFFNPDQFPGPSGRVFPSSRKSREPTSRSANHRLALLSLRPKWQEALSLQVL